MPTEAFGSPLTVWVGSTRYTFPPGRDVIVGRDNRSDIRLDGLETPSRTYLVLRFDGAQWVAIERSQTGIYLDGVRVPAVNIRDGQSITVGDPRLGPRLVFRVGAAAPTPARPPNQGAPRRPALPGRQPGRPARPGPPPAPPRRPPPAPPPPSGQRSGPPSRGATPSQSPTRPVPIAPPEPAAAPPPAPETPAQPTPSQVGPGRPKPPSQLPTGPITTARPEPPRDQPHAPPAPPQPPAPPEPPQQPPPQPPPPQPPPPQPPPPRPPPPPPPPPPPRPEQPSLQPPAQRPAPPAWPRGAQRKGRELIELVAGAMHKLLSRRPAPRPHQAAPADYAQVSPPPPAPHTGTLTAAELELTLDARQLLADVSFTAQPGTLTAVIGPSETNKSALVNLLGGELQPSSGEVTIDGHNVHAEYESLRTWIGMVPQDDVVHRQLTVEQALGYAAELRLPPDTSAEDRRQVVNRVLGELELTRHRTIQVGRLSDAERKRASVAVELLTGPALLVLDEPTAGLDPALERQAMAGLRQLADAGRVVVMATTSLACLDMCDQVLLLTPSGTTAFAGPPAEIETALQNADWSDVLTQISPEQRHTAPPETHPPKAPVEPPTHLGLRHQIAVAARRQAWLVVGDQRYFIFLAILPFLFGALSLVVPGHAGLGPADPYGDSPDEALEILVVLSIGAVVMGTALAIRDMFEERRIFRREQTIGLSASAYLAAKILVYSLVAIVQTGILTAITVLGKGAPTRPAVLLGNPVFELYVTVAATAIVSAIVALALSSLAKYRAQIPPMAVLVILLSLVFCGGLFPVDDRFGLEQISWLFPSRWGLAASASSIDVHTINLLATDDELWTHSAGWWVLDMAMLVVLGAVGTGFLWWRLRPPARRQSGDEPSLQGE